MLDVHPPHTATHTWKDFWIHLGTISAGLLIAIGLEQSVEAIHRVHERHVLMDDLRAEAEHNDDVLHKDVEGMRQATVYYTALRDRALAADKHTQGDQLPPLPSPPTGSSFLTSAGAWESARDSNQLGLLPRNLTSTYEEVYEQRDFGKTHFLLASLDADAALYHFLGQHTVPHQAFDPALLSAPDRATFEGLIDKALMSTETAAGTTTFYLNENRALLNGAQTPDQLHQALSRSY
jgi:hypothetical protein